METFNSPDHEDRPINTNPSPASGGGGKSGTFSAPISAPRRRLGNIVHSAVRNKGHQKDHAAAIRQEQEEERNRQREYIRRQRESQRAAATQQADKERRRKDAESMAKKERNAQVEREARASGAKIYKNEFGDWEHEKDESGKVIHSEYESDPFKDEKSGRFMRTKRDRYGVTKTIDADQGAEWKVVNGQLVKQNKYNAPEVMDPSKALDDPNLAPLARKALYEKEKSTLAADVKREAMELANPSLPGKLTDTQLAKAQEDLSEIQSVLATEYATDADRKRAASLESQIEAAGTYQKRQQELYEKKRRLLEMDQSGVDGWKEQREAAEEERLILMPAEDFNKEMQERGHWLKADQAELESRQLAAQEDIQMRSGEIERT